MSDRKKILARIRAALSKAAPLPGSHHGAARSTAAPPPSAGARQWLPAVGDSFATQLVKFGENAVALKTDFHLLNSRDELAARLVGLRTAEGWKKIATHTGELTDAGSRALGLPICRTDGPYDANELEGCDAALTECDALIAQTGSVLVTNRSAGGRALSALPPHHIVLAKRDQLLRDLPAAFQLLKQKYAGNYPSMISFITGPSRTGDIERILVLGAHGPKKLTIFLL